MESLVYLDSHFIEEHTDFPSLIEALQKAFALGDITVPPRHHHALQADDATLLLMPAWKAGEWVGVKVVNVFPENGKQDLPAIQGSYLLHDGKTGALQAVIDGKALTAKRTAATSALASFYLSRPDASSLLMIGTGALAPNLIRAHAAVRPIQEVWIWGRSQAKARKLCDALKSEAFECHAIKDYTEVMPGVDIISCATLSPDPLILGKYLRKGQHIDLVGAFQPDRRESDDEVIRRSLVFVDTFQGMRESGDIAIPLKSGILKVEDVKSDLFTLSSGQYPGRSSRETITMFKSVGHALEDLVAAEYYFNQYPHA